MKKYYNMKEQTVEKKLSFKQLIIREKPNQLGFSKDNEDDALLYGCIHNENGEYFRTVK